MALVERITKTTDQTAWRGEIPVNWLYTAGRAGERFLRALKEKGELLGTHCRACDITYVPPKIYCERCFERLEDSYRSLPPTGKVYSYTLCYKDRSGRPLPEPQIMALIQIDGTDTLLLHHLSEVDFKDVCIGMRVEMVLKPEGEREGSILDIHYFRPA